MITVNEQTGFNLSLTLTTVDGSPPTTLSYRIDDLYSGQNVVPSTALPPALTAEIAIPAGDNAFLNVANSQEERVVTITGNDGEDTEFNFEYRYSLQQLPFVS